MNFEAVRPYPLAAEGERTLPGVPWYLWGMTLGVTSSMVGLNWDVSWHQSVGRDDFWSPPHLAIYLCGVVVALCCAYLVGRATFLPRSEAASASVSVLGLRGPLGAFVAGWGGLSMLASAPFDDWWHNTYGLDVKLMSPPHLALLGGMLGVQVGALVLSQAEASRADPAARPAFQRQFLYLSGMLLVGVLTMSADYLVRIYMHSGLFYRTVALTVPLVLCAAHAASGARWACTAVAAVYTALFLGLLWVLPLFPAQPKLGPVFQQVEHFIPQGFPLLILVPALTLDLLLPRLAQWSAAARAAAAGTALVGTFLAVQWPFASFLMSPWARNAFFGSHYFGYGVHPDSHFFRHAFAPVEPNAQRLTLNLALALALGILGAGAGNLLGRWMQRVRR